FHGESDREITPARITSAGVARVGAIAGAGQIRGVAPTRRAHLAKAVGRVARTGIAAVPRAGLAICFTLCVLTRRIAGKRLACADARLQRAGCLPALLKPSHQDRPESEQPNFLDQPLGKLRARRPAMSGPVRAAEALMRRDVLLIQVDESDGDGGC